jgi:hypothetical protein
MRIAFLAKDYTRLIQPGGGISLVPGGCAYYRCLMPKLVTRHESMFGLPAWTSQHGFGVKDTTRSATFGFNVVVLKLLMDRWVPHQIKVAQSLGQKIVIDIDDHYDGLHESNLAYTITDPKHNKVSNRDHYNESIELADAIVVTTPFLYDHYRKKVGNKVTLIRNGIRPEQFTPLKVTSRKPVIGWAGAMQWRSNDAQTAYPWLGLFLDKHDLMFKHSGAMDNAPSFAEAAGIHPDRMILSPMKPVHEYDTMLDFDIGLVLLSDIEFNYAKSAIKGWEYAAKGIPFVAFNTPEYKYSADTGVGRVASTPEEWEKHLTELLDFKTRKRDAAINRKNVLEKHTIYARADEWNNLFNSLA